MNHEVRADECRIIDAELQSRGTKCSHCVATIGQLHDDECPRYRKNVVIKLEVLCLIDVPNSWNDHEVEFYYNDSSSCLNNLYNDIEAAKSRIDLDGSCMCGYGEVSVHTMTPEENPSTPYLNLLDIEEDTTAKGEI